MTCGCSLGIMSSNLGSGCYKTGIKGQIRLNIIPFFFANVGLFKNFF